MAGTIELEPGFTIGGLCRAVNMHESLSALLSAALRRAGLPE
jgi:adenylate cyclase